MRQQNKEFMWFCMKASVVRCKLYLSVERHTGSALARGIL